MEVFLVLLVEVTWDSGARSLALGASGWSARIPSLEWCVYHHLAQRKPNPASPTVVCMNLFAARTLFEPES